MVNKQSLTPTSITHAHLTQYSYILYIQGSVCDIWAYESHTHICKSIKNIIQQYSGATKTKTKRKRLEKKMKHLMIN